MTSGRARTAGTPLDRLLATEAQTYLADDLLVKMDIATMAHGLEARSPLLDHELIELVARLPQPFDVRMTSDDPGRTARGVEQDALEGPPVPPAVGGARIGVHG